MAVKTKEGEDLIVLAVRLNWKGQSGLEMRLAPHLGGIVMSLAHVDELIAELIQHRDTIERENERNQK
jgi:hypothetical protein